MGDGGWEERRRCVVERIKQKFQVETNAAFVHCVTSTIIHPSERTQFSLAPFRVGFTTKTSTMLITFQQFHQSFVGKLRVTSSQLAASTHKSGSSRRIDETGMDLQRKRNHKHLVGSLAKRFILQYNSLSGSVSSKKTFDFFGVGMV